MLEYVGTFVLTDSSLDRHSERVLVEGVDFDHFGKNAQMFYNHHRSDDAWWGDADATKILPIGNWKNLRVEAGQLLGDAYIDYADEWAAKVGDKVKAGVLNAVSIGFRALAYSDAEEDKVLGQKGWTITKSELREASIVDIPANPNALIVTNTLQEKSEAEADEAIKQSVIYKQWSKTATSPKQTQEAAQKSVSQNQETKEKVQPEAVPIIQPKKKDGMSLFRKLLGQDEPAKKEATPVVVPAVATPPAAEAKTAEHEAMAKVMADVLGKSDFFPSIKKLVADNTSEAVAEAKALATTNAETMGKVVGHLNSVTDAVNTLSESIKGKTAANAAGIAPSNMVQLKAEGATVAAPEKKTEGDEPIEMSIFGEFFNNPNGTLTVGAFKKVNAQA